MTEFVTCFSCRTHGRSLCTSRSIAQNLFSNHITQLFSDSSEDMALRMHEMWSSQRFSRNLLLQKARKFLWDTLQLETKNTIWRDFNSLFQVMTPNWNWSREVNVCVCVWSDSSPHSRILCHCETCLGHCLAWHEWTGDLI